MLNYFRSECMTMNLDNNIYEQEDDWLNIMNRENI